MRQTPLVFTSGHFTPLPEIIKKISCLFQLQDQAKSVNNYSKMIQPSIVRCLQRANRKIA
jgi:hypothetical protein